MTDSELVTKMRQLAIENPRYGYRRIGRLLGEAGWHVNHKRLLRLWRHEGLSMVGGRPRRCRSATECIEESGVRADAPDCVWAWDFIADRTTDGQKLWWFSLLDEFTRECLALEV